MAWIRADDQTILTLHTRLVTHSSRYAVTNDSPGSWQLHIRPLKVEDRGCYMCQINTSTMKKQIGCVDVLGKSEPSLWLLNNIGLFLCNMEIRHSFLLIV